MLGSTHEYVATVNTEELARTKDATIPLITNTVSPESHYTVILIENVRVDYPKKRSMGKLRPDIGGIYRRDIANKKIVIRYNDEELSYSAPPILETEDKDGLKKIWKKELNYTIPYRDEEYTVKGFVAIREKASLEHAGFTLFRRDRVIIGGFSGTYRPKEIFGQSNSFVYQRLFGEINLDNWPVSQAKDQFTWGEELEELFKNSINDRVGDLKNQAQNYRARPKSKEEGEEPLKPPSLISVDSYGKDTPINTPRQPVNVPPAAMVPVKQEVLIDTPPPLVPSGGQIVPNHEPITVSNTKNYQVKIGPSEVYNFHITFKELPGAPILFTKSTDKNQFNLFINLLHPMVIRAQASPDSMGTLVEMVIFLSLSEKKIESDTISGNIGADSIRLQLNELAYNQIDEVK